MTDWLTIALNYIAARKTHLVVLTWQRKFVAPFQVEFDEQEVVSVCCPKYLEVLMDKKLKFYTQVQAAADKAATIVAILLRFLPNIAAPRSSNQKALTNVIHSIILYGAEIWADVLQFEKFSKNKLQFKEEEPCE